MTKQEKARLKELKAYKKTNTLSIAETIEYVTLLNKRTEEINVRNDKLMKISIVFMVLAVIGQITAMIINIMAYFK